MSNNKINSETRVRLNNGVEMPIIGFGSWQLYGEVAEKSVLCSLRNGYRLIDTAMIYQNEKDIGTAVNKSCIPREDIFITTKLWPAEQGYKSTLNACERSLKLLKLSYIDLYLIHWPAQELLDETWNAMETLLKQGKCRAIGVSNYTIPQLEYLIDNSSVIPSVNQVEFNPYFYQKELLEFCQIHKIQVESYCPLTRKVKLTDSKLVLLSLKYHKTAAQVLIRWALQKGLVTIPKSSNEDRIRENIDIFDFEISEKDISFLDSFHENLMVPLV
jgi:diketogulonate reductase-like aldo/keto reductase